MDNEQNAELEQDNTEELQEEEVVEEEQQPEKKKLSPEARRGILLRQLKKVNKELNIVDEIEETPQREIKNSKKGFGLVEKTFLKASGIVPKEYDFVQEYVQESGIPVDELVEKRWFQLELKDFRDSSAVSDATPRGTRRSGQVTRDSVEYWIAKQQLPPADQRDLRAKVVNARIKAESSASQFSDNPVA